MTFSFRRYLRQLPPRLGLVLYGFLGVLFSLGLLFSLGSPSVRNVRAGLAQLLFEVILENSNGADGDRFAKLRRLMEERGIEAWLIDEKGNVLDSSSRTPLPVEAAEIPLSDEELSFVWRRVSHGVFENLCSLRLVGSPARYLVFYFSKEGSHPVSFLVSMAFFALWLVSVSALGGFLMGRFPREIRPISNEKGFTMLSALIGLVIAGFAMFAIQATLSLAFKGSKHSDMKLAIRSLSSSVREAVSCEKTFAQVNLAQDCAIGNQSPKPIVLRDLNGNPITGLNQSGVAFDPLSPTLQGAGSFGSFHLRAYCNSLDGDLYVRFAKVQSTQGQTVKFENDALLKRPFDWSDSASNPLFGPADRSLCRGENSTVTGAVAWEPFHCSGPRRGDMVSSVCPSFHCLIPGNMSPDDFCKSKGHQGTTGACKGVANIGIPRPFLGSLTANTLPIPEYNPLGLWYTGCWFTNPCMDVPTHIQCVSGR